jgi:PKHD-type hydroxylase
MYSDFVPRGYRKAELDRHRVISGAFSGEEVARILEQASGVELTAGKIGASELDEEIRRSRVAWLHRDQRSQWVFERIADLVLEANSELWGFELGGMRESLQYSRYEAPAGGYDWHLDVGSSSLSTSVALRKISVVIQLSDPEECFGGELELRPARHVVVPELEIGCAVLFPSYLLHRVRPVKQGVRESLVTWITGPPFR